MKLKILKTAFPYTVPVMTGYLFLGIAFGILSVSSGYSVLHAVVMSGLIYAGSMQFVTIELLNAAFQPLSAVIMTLMINARHLFYGLSMIERYQDTGKRKPYLIFSLTDETFSLVSTLKIPQEINKQEFLFGISLLNHLYWITGTLTGAVFGSVIPFNAQGIDFSMTALFLVIFIEQWESADNHVFALIGLFTTFLFRFVLGPEWFIPVSMAVIFMLLLVYYKKGEYYD